MPTLLLLYQFVSVQLFAKHQVAAITLKTDRYQIHHHHIKKMIRYPRFHGSISINQDQLKRSYQGDLTLKPKGDQIELILKIPFEQYIIDVVTAESGRLLHPEALKAFYLVVKHYTVNHLHRHKKHDFCDFAHCQLFYGRDKNYEVVRKIVAPVKDNWILYQGKMIETFYNAICGPKRADPKTIWGRSIPYITGGDNRFYGEILAKKSPNYQWHFTVNRTLFFKKTGIREIILHHDKNGYVSLVEMDQQKKRGEEFRRIIGHTFGWNRLKSNLFTIKVDQKNFHFTGYGFGHGVGFCIEEANELAQQGLNYQEILKFFFQQIDIIKKSSY